MNALTETRVVVAGAGPVGSVAAIWLAQHGVDVVLLEAGVDCAQDLRASTFHPPTLEMLDEIDVTGTLLEQGLRAPVFHYRDRTNDEIYSFDLGEIAGETRYPYRVQCEQYKLARRLTERLEAMPNAQVLFSHRLVHFEQDADGVTVTAETPLELVRLRADFLIGADGANSLVRKYLNVGFEGFTYPEKFLTMSTDWPLEEHFRDLAYVNYVSDPKEWLVLLRVPAVWRVLVPAAADASDAELVADAKKNDVFERLIGHGPDVITHHRTVYRVHQRVANRFVHGRVILVGDAAHLNNPLGGFGMNSGIHDAVSLCHTLLKCLDAPRHRESLLSLFERQRHTVTRNFIQQQSIRNKQDMELGSAEAENQRRQEMRATSENADRRREFLLRQSMIQSVRDAAAIG
ncbi:MAG: NAD(P)/FAD-dependent oxidoreductase [Gammaproteobacteria bacterium]|jgi:3-(3-hydroxy-phenyl)propionate hydroxylase|nr:NAD(P)/FAD-dependent oxidoreductase [Gammaproteobacteria bacterium]